MQNIIPTFWANILQTAKLGPTPFVPPAYSTINEDLSIQPGVNGDPSAYPGLGVFVIGNGGHRQTVAKGGIVVNDIVPHRSTDAGLYRYLPFIIRPTSNDLDATTRAKYALRTTITVNGVNYIAYYGKRFNLVQQAPVMYYNTANGDGTFTTTNFVPNQSNLRPTPPPLDSNGAYVTSGDNVTVSAPIVLTLTADDMMELVNVATILYNDPRTAIISEVGLVTSLDKSVTTGGVTYTEIISAQIAAFVYTMITSTSHAGGASINLDTGATEPLLTLNK